MIDLGEMTLGEAKKYLIEMRRDIDARLMLLTALEARMDGMPITQRDHSTVGIIMDILEKETDSATQKEIQDKLYLRGIERSKQTVSVSLKKLIVLGKVEASSVSGSMTRIKYRVSTRAPGK